MRAAPIWASLLAAGACALPPSAPLAFVAAGRLVPMPNADFEAPPRPLERCPIHWGCSMHNNPDSFRFVMDSTSPGEGSRSLCVERVLAEPWSLATQLVRDPGLKGARAKLSMLVRRESGAGPGAGAFLQAFDGRQGIADTKALEARTSGWKRVMVELDLPGETAYVVAGFTLEGDGRACVDDVRLEILPESAKPSI